MKDRVTLTDDAIIRLVEIVKNIVEYKNAGDVLAYSFIKNKGGCDDFYLTSIQIDSFFERINDLIDEHYLLRHPQVKESDV